MDIAEAMQRVGEDGLISVEEAKSSVSELEIVEGLQIDKGYISSYFINNSEKMVCELEMSIEMSYILIYDQNI